MGEYGVSGSLGVWLRPWRIVLTSLCDGEGPRFGKAVVGRELLIARFLVSSIGYDAIGYGYA